MAEIAIIGLLALMVVLLFLCWMGLRFIGSEVVSLSTKIYSFLYDYERLNGFEERGKLADEVAVDRDFAEWQARSGSSTSGWQRYVAVDRDLQARQSKEVK